MQWHELLYSVTARALAEEKLFGPYEMEAVKVCIVLVQDHPGNGSLIRGKAFATIFLFRVPFVFFLVEKRVFDTVCHFSVRETFLMKQITRFRME